MRVRTFRSSVLPPRDRGEEFGRAFGDRIAGTVAAYRELFSLAAGGECDLAEWGGRARNAIAAFSPAALAEIEGIAAGSRLPVTDIAAINARTEILAACTRRGDNSHPDGDPPVRAGECSTVVHLDDAGAPVAVQVWDWYDNLGESWLVWEIPTARGMVTTVTEFGILGKIGVNTDGVGVLFNILHHAEDGQGIGVPVHILARTILDTCTDLGQALTLAAGAQVSASSSLTVIATVDRGRRLDSDAVAIEVNPHRIGYHLPDDEGLFVHTNHFLTASVGEADQELLAGPDTVVRYAGIRRRLRRRFRVTATITLGDALTSLDSHVLGGGGSCCHPDPDRVDLPQFASLATISLDVPAGTLTAHPGGPCTHSLLRE